MKYLGERMGALDLPVTYAGTEKAIENYIPDLYFGERARSIVQLLENFPSNLATRPIIKLMSRAGFLNLPDWVYPFIGKPMPSDMERFAIRKSIELIAVPMRAALKDGVAAHSLRRIYG